MDKLIEQFNDIQINKKNIKNVRCDGFDKFYTKLNIIDKCIDIITLILS